MREIVVITHNIRSCYNVGSIFRTADGLGAAYIYLCGYTPYPLTSRDERLPYLARKIDAQIRKTSLGAEHSVGWKYIEDTVSVITELRNNEYAIVALEQTTSSTALNIYKAPSKVALVLGNEIEGLPSDVLSNCANVVEIPMAGLKESYNVSIAAAIALYHLRYSV